MAADQILDPNYRALIIQDIEGDENRRRKQESLKRWEIYKDRLEPYLYSILQNQMGVETTQDLKMRVISSINLCRRIIDEQSSIYNKRPVRALADSDEKTDELFAEVYNIGRFNTSFKQANILFNLMDQCSIQIIPKSGKLRAKVLAPHHYDVIPNDMNPEVAEVYILSQFDKDNGLFNIVENSNNVTPQSSAVEYRNNDGINQPIGDSQDWKASRKKYVWWSENFHFMTDDKGNVLDKNTGRPMERGFDENGERADISVEDILNPIQKLPFVDVKEETDGEYWQRYGNSTVDFTQDMGLILSDVAEVNRLQGYAVPIIAALEKPATLNYGPTGAIFLKKKKGGEAGEQPEFSFASPNPDLSGSIEMVKMFLAVFLTSKGLDPSVVAADASGAKFSSGIERLLSNIEKFEASQDDFDLFKSVETDVFKLVKCWLGAFQGVTDGSLIDELTGIIPEDVKMNVEFLKPMAQISDTDQIAVLEKKLDLGLITKLEAIMKDREIDEDAARDILEQIELDNPIDKLSKVLLRGNREQEVVGE